VNQFTDEELKALFDAANGKPASSNIQQSYK
jgi:hypothetical protein